MFARAIQRRLASSVLRNQSALRNVARTQRRHITRAPKAGETLMERRADRELPDVESVSFRWSRSLPIFFGLIALSSIAIFNYQKSSSSVIASTLYALRTNTHARELLGDEIYFQHRIPWISGELNQLKGRIDVHFKVKGTRGSATMTFRSFRPAARGLFETAEWSLVMDGDESGRKIDLLDGNDPFRAIPGAHLIDDEDS
ncbi:unnamed protein product [Parascedosporium putredinis]|uniref:DUF1783-domain-containing protein n=1 Tax=Parascedosporium putredinis TaxID=1442378 RepID=A0A9P1H8X6_9PEZI|nr:unnamed protein product [Parascedosporium putredinis]CAI8001278.1 unnamed protein product [Parascedosporium putredinis]